MPWFVNGWFILIPTQKPWLLKTSPRSQRRLHHGVYASRCISQRIVSLLYLGFHGEAKAQSHVHKNNARSRVFPFRIWPVSLSYFTQVHRVPRFGHGEATSSKLHSLSIFFLHPQSPQWAQAYAFSLHCLSCTEVVAACPGSSTARVTHWEAKCAEWCHCYPLPDSFPFFPLITSWRITPPFLLGQQLYNHVKRFKSSVFKYTLMYLLVFLLSVFLKFEFVAFFPPLLEDCFERQENSTEFRMCGFWMQEG